MVGVYALSLSEQFLFALQDKPLEALCTVRPSSELHVNLHAWLSGEANASFQSWRQSMPSSKRK